MIKKTFSITVMLLLSSALLYAKQSPAVISSSGGVNWFQLIVSVGYVLGVFVLLPLVLYTNVHERLFDPLRNSKDMERLKDLSEDERNDRTLEVLEKIEEQLSHIKSDDGREMLTITNAKQVKYTKAGLDYINRKLHPTDQELIVALNEIAGLYNDRTKRVFTGSPWIIFFSLALGVVFVWSGGITSFIFIHVFGLLFYILSSRTRLYDLEKRIEYFGDSRGVLSSVISGLFIGAGVEYYIKESGASGWKRDWETEGVAGLFSIFIMIVVAMFLGFMAAFLGVINFIINYSKSFIMPFRPQRDFYEVYVSGAQL